MRRRIILEGNKIEKVTINISTSNGASASGITITINGSATTTNADGVAYGEVPFDTEYSIVFGEKTSYSTPATITRTASADTYTTAVTYTLLNERCTVTTNLATTITINGSASSSNVKSYSVDVPYGTVYTVSVADNSNYNKPSNKTFTASTSSRSVTMNYTAKTETVKITSNIETYFYFNGRYIGYGTSAQTAVTYGTVYTISGSSIDWYNTPSVQTFTANTSTRNVSLDYSEKSIYVRIKYINNSSYEDLLTQGYFTLVNPDNGLTEHFTVSHEKLTAGETITRSVNIGDALRNGYIQFYSSFQGLTVSLQTGRDYDAGQIASVDMSPSGSMQFGRMFTMCYLEGEYVQNTNYLITVNSRG